MLEIQEKEFEKVRQALQSRAVISFHFLERLCCFFSFVFFSK